MRYVVGVYNGFDVDDYYVDADSVDEACNIATAIACGGEVYIVHVL